MEAAKPTAEALVTTSPVSDAVASLFRLALYLVALAFSLTRAVAAFLTLRLPAMVLRMLSWGVDLRFTFNNLVFLLVLGALGIGTWVQRKNRKYRELRDEPNDRSLDDGYDLHPDLAADQAPSFHNYLDEFLSAIKVFGYLEKPVFHELARHLQTRRLIAGDTINLESDKSFYIVVDGNVQVYAQTGSTAGSKPKRRHTDYDDEDDNGFQLLNNVESGGTLSSLFTILSLFTEDVKLRYEEEPPLSTSHSRDSRSRQPSAQFHQHLHNMDRNPDVSDLLLDPNAVPFPTSSSSSSKRRGSSLSRPPMRHATDSPVTRTRHLSGSSDRSESTMKEHDFAEEVEELEDEDSRFAPEPRSPTSASQSNRYSPFMADGMSSMGHSMPSTPGFSGLNIPLHSSNGKREDETRVGEGTIARATVDTTLAVIPAEAFRRLTKKFPNAAAHIVQVILTRLQRVTFLTAHKYLKLTKEVVRTEKAINDLANYPLPEEFWEGGGIQRLRQRFLPETKAVDHGTAESEMDYFALDPPTPYNGPAPGRAVPEPGNDREFEGVKLKYRQQTKRGRKDPASVFGMSTITSEPESAHAPGDTSPLKTPRVKSPKVSLSASVSSKMGGASDEFDLRDAVMECISKAIGLVQPSVSTAPSVNASPMVKPVDTQLQRAVFNSSFGSLSFLGTQGYDDASSITASSIASISSEIENEVEILYFPKDSTLVKAGEKNAGLYFVIEGFLDVYMPEDPVGGERPPKPTGAASTAGGSTNTSTPKRTRSDARFMSDETTFSAGSSRFDLPPMDANGKEQDQPQKSIHLFTVKPGGIAGYLSSLSGFPSYVDIKSKTEVYVGFLPARAMEKIMDRKPIVLLTLAKRLISLLSPLVLHIDSALEWVHVSAGQVLYRQGDASDSFYIVLNGRLRSINEKDGGGVTIQGEYGQGESVGELDCITNTPRPTTLHAIRDSELARMPMTLFNAISVRHPLVTIQISRIIASRVRQQMDAKLSMPALMPTAGDGGRLGKNNFNLKTIAILPTTRHVPVTEFASKLEQALENIGAPTSYLNQATVMTVLGRHAFSRMGTLKLAGWLSENEQRYRIVLYVVDTSVSSPWTQTCIRQADCILIVADGGMDSGLGEYEKLLVSLKTTARKELVLLHSERYVGPGTTRPWLKRRPFVQAHHHIQMASATAEVHASPFDDPVPVALRKIKEKVEGQIGKYRKTLKSTGNPPSIAASDDFSRLARRLCGKSVGVVLGGGGARGIAHIGTLRALSEAGVPIDIVGGTSIGAFIGGLYAREASLVSTFGRAKRFSGRMSTLWRMLTDLTYPVVSYTTGHEFNRGIYKSFYDLQIEDMWLPFFCNTTNITHSRMDFHTSGYAWRYIRASMSLAGLLPPLCEKGDMLVDGGYVDNLPVSFMLSMGASSVFAVDVGSVDDTSPRNYGESVSGWWVLINRWNPFSDAIKIPTLTEIQSRLTYVSSVKTLEEAKATPGVLYMRMPVTQFGTMEFKSFPSIMEVGLNSSADMIETFRKDGQLPDGMEGPVEKQSKKKRGQSIRRNSI